MKAGYKYLVIYYEDNSFSYISDGSKEAKLLPFEPNVGKLSPVNESAQRLALTMLADALEEQQKNDAKRETASIQVEENSSPMEYHFKESNFNIDSESENDANKKETQEGGESTPAGEQCEPAPATECDNYSFIPPDAAEATKEYVMPDSIVLNPVVLGPVAPSSVISNPFQTSTEDISPVQSTDSGPTYW